jgi:hypothetical protein
MDLSFVETKLGFRPMTPGLWSLPQILAKMPSKFSWWENLRNLFLWGRKKNLLDSFYLVQHTARALGLRRKLELRSQVELAA